MRLHGWCEQCHKVKLVTVRYPRAGQVQVGICAGCEDARRQYRRR